MNCVLQIVKNVKCILMSVRAATAFPCGKKKGGVCSLEGLLVIIMISLLMKKYLNEYQCLICI